MNCHNLFTCRSHPFDSSRTGARLPNVRGETSVSGCESCVKIVYISRDTNVEAIRCDDRLVESRFFSRTVFRQLHYPSLSRVAHRARHASPWRRLTRGKFAPRGTKVRASNMENRKTSGRAILRRVVEARQFCAHTSPARFLNFWHRAHLSAQLKALFAHRSSGVSFTAIERHSRP